MLENGAATELRSSKKEGTKKRIGWWIRRGEVNGRDYLRKKKKKKKRPRRYPGGGENTIEKKTCVSEFRD